MKVNTYKPQTPLGNVLDEILTNIASEMSKEMKFDALLSVRNARGWTLVELTPFSTRNAEAAEWAKEHILGQWDHGGSLSSKFVFEREEDATAFLLKWK